MQGDSAIAMEEKGQERTSEGEKKKEEKKRKQEREVVVGKRASALLLGFNLFLLGIDTFLLRTSLHSFLLFTLLLSSSPFYPSSLPTASTILM